MNRYTTETLIPLISTIKKHISEVSSGKLFFLTVSGSDLYGFPSANSDLDLRGAFIAHSNHFLGLHNCKTTINSVNPDYQIHELKKEIMLALKGNCNILEHLFSKPIYHIPEYITLKKLIADTLSKNGIYKSYRGMATFNYKKFILGGKQTYKKYLYVFRGLLAGRYFLETGKIEPNITKINSTYKFNLITKLVKSKKTGDATALIKNIDCGELEKLITHCYLKIDSAYEKSKLPETPSNKDLKTLNSYLLKLRKTMLT